MKKKILTGLLLVCTIAVCFAATVDISGKWKGILKLDDGTDFPLSYTFKVDGAKLTGAVQSTLGELPIENGVVKGDSISFTVNYNGSDIPNKGKCYADSISLNSVINDANFHITLTKDK